MKARMVVHIALLVLVVLVPAQALAGSHGIPMAAVQWVVGDMMENDGPGYWKPGMGFNLMAALPVSHAWEVRADWGVRWLEGESRVVTDPEETPRRGGLEGEASEDLRVMPTTLGLVYRLEGISKGRCWLPYVGAGGGFYDLNATFTDAEQVERDDSQFRWGWHARGGTRFYRTSGMHVSLEAGVHFIDTSGEMTPMWEVSLGLGSLLTGGSR